MALVRIGVKIQRDQQVTWYDLGVISSHPTISNGQLKPLPSCFSVFLDVLLRQVSLMLRTNNHIAILIQHSHDAQASFDSKDLDMFLATKKAISDFLPRY
jgi:hypothetical protein